MFHDNAIETCKVPCKKHESYTQHNIGINTSGLPTDPVSLELLSIACKLLKSGNVDDAGTVFVSSILLQRKEDTNKKDLVPSITSISSAMNDEISRIRDDEFMEHLSEDEMDEDTDEDTGEDVISPVQLR